MKTNSTPVRTTLIYGGMGAALLFVLSFIYPMTPYSFWYRLYGWLLIAGYGYLLAGWSATKLGQIIAPIFLAFIAACFAPMGSLLCILPVHLLCLSWIRSSICFPDNRMRGIMLETVLCFGAAMAATTLTPTTRGGAAIAIWIFFLLQALYFPLALPGRVKEKSFTPDVFDRARGQAEKILAGGGEQRS